MAIFVCSYKIHNLEQVDEPGSKEDETPPEKSKPFADLTITVASKTTSRGVSIANSLINVPNISVSIIMSQF